MTSISVNRLLLLVWFFGMLIVTGNSELNIAIKQMKNLAENFGERLYKTSKEATGIAELHEKYRTHRGTKVEEVDGISLRKEMKEQIQKMLNLKVKAIKNLVEEAEKANVNISFDEESESEDMKDFQYYNAKKINGYEGGKLMEGYRDFPLNENEHFNFLRVNTNISTVHVPTNVYDQSKRIMEDAYWSQALDPVFRKNYEKDPTLTWQYFGSASGLFRNFPGAKWHIDHTGVDTYDCRARPWYIQAATHPKDIVILVDASGSMTGLRMEIAKVTIEKILQTLSDDDFFNIIVFNEEPWYVDSCFNKTLVQANADNKKRLETAFEGIKTENIARFDKALAEAFELLEDMEREDTGAMCNKAIMVITDGAPENHEEVFEKYNWPEKNVRVFTYLIGREVTDTKQVKWMACANKGYFARISTLADVQEHVQDYIHVLSRPLVLHEQHDTIWTSIYMDEAHDLEGLRLMTSVAQPVFDKREETRGQGVLLGVAGTDVPVRELTKLTPKYKLGVNGYAFAITNNGYLLFHPDFRPMKDGTQKPNYNSVDIAEVEIPVRDSVKDGLRMKMIDRLEGMLEMEVLVHYDNMKRVVKQKNEYYYTALAKTPFSFAIVLPKDGKYRVNGKVKNLKSLEKSFNRGKFKIAPWHFCRMSTNETRMDRTEVFLKYMKLAKSDEKLFKEKCEEDLWLEIAYDADMTQDAHKHWTKKPFAGSPEKTHQIAARRGVELVFLGTKAGLTRYLQIAENLTDPMFLEENDKTIEETYYKRAVEGGKDVFTYSVPLPQSHDPNNTVITASSPIFVEKGGNKAPAAVAGLQIKYNKLEELLMNVSHSVSNRFQEEQCRGRRNCRIKKSPMCESEQMGCYLLDNNGYVVYSENFLEVGNFYGEVDGRLFHEMHDNLKLFEQFEMFDYQALCHECSQVSSASFLLNPLKKFFSVVHWIFMETIMFLAEFSISSWWNSAKLFVQGVPCPPYPQWVEMLQSDPPSSPSEAVIYYKYLHTLPKILGEKGCEKRFKLYKGTFDKIPDNGISGSMTDCGPAYNGPCNSSKSYYIQKVANSNLLFLAVDATCECPMGMEEDPYTGEHITIEYNDTAMCDRLQESIYRRRPTDSTDKTCRRSHSEEQIAECGGTGSYHHPSLLTILVLWLLAHHCSSSAN